MYKKNVYCFLEDFGCNEKMTVTHNMLLVYYWKVKLELKQIYLDTQ